MPKPDDFYTTKVLIEVEVSHQFDPKDGINLVTGLLSVPAIEKVNVLSAVTNYRLFEKPSEQFVAVDLSGNYDVWSYSDKEKPA
jgi:hypothetical protein